MNSFISNLEKEASNALFVASFRGIISMIGIIADSGTFIDDVDEAIVELIINGSYQGNVQYLMSNNTIPFWEEKMNAEAEKIGVELNITLTDVFVDQYDPWHLTFSGKFVCSLRDKNDLASWKFNFTRNTSISIEDLSDPFFIIYTGNQLNRNVLKSPYLHNYTSRSQVVETMEEGYYISFKDAPDYLMRLEGEFGSSPNGIETLVDKEELAKIVSIDETLSNVDYLFFSDDSVTTYTFSGMVDYFKLDNLSDGEQTHIDAYNLSSWYIG